LSSFFSSLLVVTFVLINCINRYIEDKYGLTMTIHNLYSAVVSISFCHFRFVVEQKQEIVMDEIRSIATVDQKMAEMRIKNIALFKRHQVWLSNVD
jgi:hypothetical protein